MGDIGCFRKLEDWIWGMMMVNQSTQNGVMKEVDWS